VHGHGLDAARDDIANAGDELVQLPLGNQVDGRMIIARQDVLTEHDLHPARDGEHFLGIAEETPAVPEQAAGIRLMSLAIPDWMM